MTIYKIIMEDRNYSNWKIYDANNFEKKELQIDPIENKLFSNDIFTFEKNKVNLIHSSLKNSKSIPGVLIVSNNKTYGRKNGKLLYKCIPDDTKIPVFLIPYEIKKMGFSKVFVNLYVTFVFTEWNDKHPHGILTNLIGQVDVLDCFYEYQLYCKSLNISLQQFQRATSKVILNKSHEVFIENIKKKYKTIEDRTDKTKWRIFSIDPKGCLDFDDAFSIQKFEDDSSTTSCNSSVVHKISIYISNVTIWIDALNLWDSFSRRVSTIYLPDKRRPMLPTILSEGLCSLQENVTRIAFVMDILVKDNEIIDVEFSNCFIKLYKNYVYDENKLLMDDDYQMLLEVTQKLSKKFKYMSTIKDSHDVVTYLMILMNYKCALRMLKFKTGIFRSTTTKENVIVPKNLPDDVDNFIKIWHSTAGQYIDGSQLVNEDLTKHGILDMEAYIHITSPIRRLVDLLNMIQFQKMLNLIDLSENVIQFYNDWINDLDYINTTMRSIRKIQTDCSLLDLCSNNPDIMEKIYNGYVLDKIVRNDGLYQYIIFLPDLKMNSRITIRENMENYENRKFKLFLFHDEEKFKKKIRLQLLDFSHNHE
uniref:RNB domain-containing protein n=1 Tax=viral metagenome TaxID=1070528 RepID=A0A6C0DGR5_9ZZZZ